MARKINSPVNDSGPSVTIRHQSSPCVFVAAGSVLWGVFHSPRYFGTSSPAARAIRAGCATSLRAHWRLETTSAVEGCGLVSPRRSGLRPRRRARSRLPPIQVRAEGSFPLQYIESVSSKSRQHNLTAAPYLGLIATANLAPDLSTSVFTNGGHNELGNFRDNDNTFVSAGGNLVKRWGALSTGISVEHTHYYDGIFGPTTNIANDVNLFAGYIWGPNPDLRITPAATVTIRLDETFAVQRYTYGARVEIEQRLSGPWWAFVTPRAPLSRLRRQRSRPSRHAGRHRRRPEVRVQRQRQRQDAGRLREPVVERRGQRLRQIQRRSEPRLRHRLHAAALALAYLSMILSENWFPLFGIML